MAISMKLKRFLDEHKVNYRVTAHPEAYTAQEIAAALHVPGKELAKVVMVKAGKKFIMAVLPASGRIEMSKLKDALGEKDIRLATEDEFKNLFPDCEPGSMPPFGNLYGLEVYEDKALSEDEEIVFQAGNHIESVKIRHEDFEKLVKPRVADFSVHLH